MGIHRGIHKVWSNIEKKTSTHFFIWVEYKIYCDLCGGLYLLYIRVRKVIVH